MTAQIFFLFFVIWLSSCASTNIQTITVNAASRLKSNVVNNVPFIEQKIGHCGPATLAMAIAATQSPYNIDEIIEQVYTPKAQGSLQENMIASARRQGFMALTLRGFDSLLAELDAGHAVIIFENLGINWFPQWHYALVTGYDLKTKTLTMHSGPNPNQTVDMTEFELSWKLTNYWGLVVLKPGTIAPSSGEIAHLQAAAALEKSPKIEEAKKAYLAILNMWPQSLIGHIGIGNVLYALKDYSSAVRYLKAATKLYPESIEAQSNLKTAQKALRLAARNPLTR